MQEDLPDADELEDLDSKKPNQIKDDDDDEDEKKGAPKKLTAKQKRKQKKGVKRVDLFFMHVFNLQLNTYSL